MRFNTTAYGLPAYAVTGIAAVLTNFPQVEQALLYGSRARGNFQSGSDIDLCLYGKGLTVSLLFKIEHALDNLLLPYKIDLTIHDQIDNHELLAQIEQLGISLYRRSKEQHMITKEEMVTLFEDMKQNAPWDISKPLLWGYFFADADKAKLENASTALKAKGYQVVGIYDSKPEAGNPALWWLHIEKVEKHTVDTLHARNQEFYKFAEEHQLESYDGMDVGPAQ